MVMVKNIAALARGLVVIETLQETGPVALAELQERTGLAKATLLRILRTLVEQGWVFRGLGDHRYRLRAELRIRSHIPGRHEHLIERAGPILERLQQQTGWPSSIAVRDQYRMHILESTSRALSLQLNYRVIGFRVHIPWSAFGRAYLAYCPDDERAELLEALARSSDPRDRIVTAPGWVERTLREVREHGYGTRMARYWLSHDSPPEPLDAIAVPVLAADDKVLAVLNLVWLSSATSTDTIAHDYLPDLLEAARALASSLQAGSASGRERDQTVPKIAFSHRKSDKS